MDRGQEYDERAEQAQKEARRAKFWAWVWWIQLPIVIVGYWLVSQEPSIEKAILVYLAAVSIIALAATYEAKAQAAEAKAAGYENP